MGTAFGQGRGNIAQHGQIAGGFEDSVRFHPPAVAFGPGGRGVRLGGDGDGGCRGMEAQDAQLDQHFAASDLR